MTHDDDEMHDDEINDDEINDDELDRKAILLLLPLQTHIDMVALTLDNLEMKLAYIKETKTALSGEDSERLMRLSARLVERREGIECALKYHSSLRGAVRNGSCDVRTKRSSGSF